MKTSPIAPLFETDTYKTSHLRQYPEGTEYVYSNYTNRGSRMEGIDKAVVFGIQAFIQHHLMDAYEDFFAANEDEVCRLYEARLLSHLGPNDVGSDHIRALHRKGYLPLHIRALPEGTLAPMQIPVLTVENTDPEFFWLTNYIETILSASIWFPTTSATKSYYMRKRLDAWAAKTGAAPESVDFQWHDFSFRGQTSAESAAASGAGHALSFLGSDNLNVFEWVDAFYPGANEPLILSVPASEHAVMSAGTAEVNELETYRRIISLYPAGIVSVVSDTYDLWNVLTNILPTLKDDIMGRDGKLVIRPDSGDPADILCGTVREFGKGTTPEEKGVIELLWEEFGGTLNEKGYRELDSHVGSIYGDSITPERAEDILQRLMDKGFASSNVVFGAGSFFFQGSAFGSISTRDALGSALKATFCQINGKAYNIVKDPITGASKKSATGRLSVVRDADGELTLIQKASPEDEARSELTPLWKDGQFVRKQSFADIREVLKNQ